MQIFSTSATLEPPRDPKKSPVRNRSLRPRDFAEECTLLTPGKERFKILTGCGNGCMMHALVRFAPLGVSPELFRVPSIIKQCMNNLTNSQLANGQSSIIGRSLANTSSIEDLAALFSTSNPPLPSPCISLFLGFQS